MEIRIGTGNLDRLIPDERLDTRRTRPVRLHERARAFGVDEAEGMHAEALHHARRSRNGTIARDPAQHVRGFGHKRREVPERVVGGSGLLDPVVGLGPDRMDEVG